MVTRGAADCCRLFLCRGACGPGAGSNFIILLRVGDQMTRETRVIDIKEKSGRSGPLVFVVVRHEISNARG